MAEQQQGNQRRLLAERPRLTSDSGRTTIRNRQQDDSLAAVTTPRGITATPKANKARLAWFLALPTLALAAPASAAQTTFEEVAEAAGLRFVHVNGMTGDRWLAEIVGAGAAALDFDDDGRVDLWLVQGGPLAGRTGELPGDRLFRNVSDGDALRFEDITNASGVRATGYGMGIATGDIDNDGDLDVFLANYGPNQLFENVGGGKFRDITASAGVAGDEWSVGASFADIDDDGLADLFVGNYLHFTLANHKDCRDLASRLSYCAPSAYRPVADRLYHNMGDKRFEDISTTAGITSAYGGALGVVAEDFDNDGRTDFYVANDGVENQLWLNQGNARFVDEALFAGVALNGNGAAEASMGVDAEDFDGDCDIDLFLTHLRTETNTLYVNHGGWFQDASNRTGVAAGSGPFTGFGTSWFDADNDGDLDLFSANGAVREISEQRDADDPYPLRQRNQLWLNDGEGRYVEQPGGPAFDLVEVSRGAAFADFDNDGDTDVVVTNNSGPARLYRNETPPATAGGAAWLGVTLHAASGKPVSGALVSLLPTNGPTPGSATTCRRKRAATDGGYASAHDPRMIFGLGANGAPRTVKVRWPTGDEERFGPLAANRYHLLRQGDGR